jgi:inward rectifier potassium channel
MATLEERAQRAGSDQSNLDRDLGFGSVVARESRQRLLNRDGSFNVRREGLGPLGSLSLYHFLLTTSWPKFLSLVVAGYLALNGAFALIFVACGPGALAGASEAEAGGSAFLRAFFFSVQTFATIGYGQISPNGLAANIAVTVESLVGLLGFALATGLLFARFSRPTAKIVFSERALISPYEGGTAFEFRIVNSRNNQLIEVACKVLVTYTPRETGQRTFTALNLERPRVTFFPLSWTIVHPIDEQSPLHGLSQEELLARNAEFLILLTGFDETFSQTVHTRSSYKAAEVVWGATFESMFKPPTAAGVVRIDVGRLHSYRRVPLPADRSG